MNNEDGGCPVSNNVPHYDTFVSFSVICKECCNFDEFEFISRIAEQLNNNGLFASEPLDEKAADSYYINGEEQYTFLLFNSAVNKYHFQVLFETKSDGNNRQIDVDISSFDYTVDFEDNYLEQLKVKIKEYFRTSAFCASRESVVWNYDKECEILASDLYTRFFSAENSLRQLISTVMNKKFGSAWWKNYVPEAIQQKHDARKAGYKSAVTTFSNISSWLLSVDTGDLWEIMTHKILKWSPTPSDEIAAYLSGMKSMSDNKLFSILLSQTSVQIDLWEEQFKALFPDRFDQLFKTFEQNRNHVAHNKLLDRMAYDSIKRNIGTVEIAISDANRKFEAQNPSDEQKAIDNAKQTEWEATYLELAESDAGVEILGSDKISEIFNEKISKIYQQIVDDLRFRADLEISDIEEVPENDDSGVLFTIRHKITEDVISVEYRLNIDDSQGGNSTLGITLKYGEEKEACGEITISNSEIEYNDDVGTHVPISDVDITEDDICEPIVELVSKHLESLREKVDGAMYSIIKDGGNSPVADGICCWECGEEYICVNEEYAPIGTCLNCGEHTDIFECSRCGCWDEGEADENEPNFCENCLDHFEKE